MSDNFVELLADFQEEGVLKLTRQRLESKEDPVKILDDSPKGMEIVGKRFAEGEYFLTELIFSGELLKQINDIVKLFLKGAAAPEKRPGKVVIGTVAGDIHDIGPNIVEFMLDVNGFDVTNLGVNVTKEKFIEAIKPTGARVIGLNGFLTPGFDAMK
jgi:methanogenic corrinoid protein MtbC1